MRLILIQTAYEGDDLVDLDSRAVLASGRDICSPTADIPKVWLGSDEEAEINGNEDGDWPGWDSVFDWLNKRFPAPPPFEVGDPVSYRKRDMFGFEWVNAVVEKVNGDKISLRTQPGNVFICIPAHALTKVKTVWRDTHELVKP